MKNKKPRIGVIDCGYGNIRSISEAINYVGGNVVGMKCPNGFLDIDGLVLPGVGTFGNVMKNLNMLGWNEGIPKFINSEKPFLGICVGMQVLMSEGNEFGKHTGLNIISGKTVSLSRYRKDGNPSPHIGWSRVSFEKENFHHQGHYFYFNHSFVCEIKDKTLIKATAKHDKSWPVIIKSKNVTGIQCHPEKSHNTGLSFLRAFLEETL